MVKPLFLMVQPPVSSVKPHFSLLKPTFFMVKPPFFVGSTVSPYVFRPRQRRLPVERLWPGSLLAGGGGQRITGGEVHPQCLGKFPPEISGGFLLSIHLSI